MDEALIREMYEERKRNGTSLRELADRYGGTYESIRLAFRSLDLPTERNPRLRQIDVWARKEEIFEAYRRLGSIDRVAHEQRLPKREVRAVIQTMPLRNIFRRTSRNNRVTDKDVEVAIRRAWRLSGMDVLTIPAYREIASKHNLPALRTIVRVKGSWSAACESAGIPHNPPRGRYASSFTYEDCARAIRACTKGIGAAPSYDRYRAWQRTHPEHPSGPTIRVVAGPWTEIVARALDDLAKS